MMIDITYITYTCQIPENYKGMLYISYIKKERKKENKDEIILFI